MNILADNSSNVFLSNIYLKNNGIDYEVVKKWRKRNVCKYTYISGRIYYDYDTIPEPTRKKLPEKCLLLFEARKEHESEKQQGYLNELLEAYGCINVGRWRNAVLTVSDCFTDRQLLEFARKASVFERILSIYSGNRGDLEPLYNAYLQLYPDSFSKKNRFCMAVRKAKKEGILSVAVNHSCLNRPERKYGDTHRYYAMFVLNHNKGYCVTDAYEKFAEACEKDKIQTPTFKWFWNFYQENKNVIDANRLGKSAWDKKCRNYASIIPALHAGDQWQMDGWRIPVYYKKANPGGGTE